MCIVSVKNARTDVFESNWKVWKMKKTDNLERDHENDHEKHTCNKSFVHHTNFKMQLTLVKSMMYALYHFFSIFNIECMIRDSCDDESRALWLKIWCLLCFQNWNCVDTSHEWTVFPVCWMLTIIRLPKSTSHNKIWMQLHMIVLLGCIVNFMIFWSFIGWWPNNDSPFRIAKSIRSTCASWVE